MRRSHVVLVVDTADATEQERDECWIAHKGSVSDKSLMTTMKKIYERRFPALADIKAKECPHVGLASAMLIDTTHLQALEIADQVIESALDVIELKIAARELISEEEVELLLRILRQSARKDNISVVREYLKSFVERARQFPPTIQAS